MRVRFVGWVKTQPTGLFDQLAEGGLVVAPIGPSDQQHLHVIRKVDGRADARALFPCRFVKLIGEEGWSGP